MVGTDIFKAMARSFENATEEPHFHKTSFRVNKKIFATLDSRTRIVVLKLSEPEQSAFGVADPTIIYLVAGAWGKQGWTSIELKKVRKNILKAVLTSAYCRVAPVRLSKKYQLD